MTGHVALSRTAITTKTVMKVTLSKSNPFSGILIRGTPGWCPEDFLSLCALFFPDKFGAGSTFASEVNAMESTRKRLLS